jgi:tetratricopeptide (TPR) repeat protein
MRVFALLVLVVAAEPYSFPSPPFPLQLEVEKKLMTIEQARAARTDDPKQVAAAMFSLKMRGLPAEAIKVGEACAHPACKMLLGIMLTETDRAGDAEAILRPFVDKLPAGRDKSATLMTLGKAQLARGDVNAALSDFRGAIKEQPDAVTPKAWEAYALVFAGKHADAIKILDALPKVDNEERAYFRARAAAGKPDGKKLLEQSYDGLLKRVQDSPDIGRTHWYLADVATQLGKNDVAAVHRERAKQLMVTRDLYLKH